MSDREGSEARSHSYKTRSNSYTPEKSPIGSVGSDRLNSCSPRSQKEMSKSPVRVTPPRSRSRSRGNRRHYSRSRSHSRRRYRSRSRSYSPYGRQSRGRYSRGRHSRSRSPYGRRGGGGSPNHRRGHHRSHSRSPMSNRRRHVCSRDDPKSSRCLGIFGLSLYTQEKDLRDVFGQYGPIEEVQVVYDHQTGRSRGFAFIYFRCTDDAVEAKDQATGIEIDGRRIRVDYSITERAHTPTPGIYLGKPTSSGYRRRSPSPYYHRRSRYSYSRSRSRSYSPRRY
ncbi:hypothetical protein LSAT2_003442 [Lamellibrachia satsuma]|nr:hypothetical protein LSAT2_003442 [Lamellibrachia satsuma]